MKGQIIKGKTSRQRRQAAYFCLFLCFVHGKKGKQFQTMLNTLQSRTGPEQGFPCVVILTEKNLFSLQGTVNGQGRGGL